MINLQKVLSFLQALMCSGLLRRTKICVMILANANGTFARGFVTFHGGFRMPEVLCRVLSQQPANSQFSAEYAQLRRSNSRKYKGMDRVMIWLVQSL